MWSNLQETADLVTFTEEILIGKLHCLCSIKRPPNPLTFNKSTLILQYIHNEINWFIFPHFGKCFDPGN